MWNAPHRRMCLNTPGTDWKTWETETFKKLPPGLTWGTSDEPGEFQPTEQFFSLQPAPWMEPIYPP